MTDSTRRLELKGWHVLSIFLVFFGVMFGVNGVFLHRAVISFPGEQEKKSYLQGLTYNQTLEARRAQIDLGWQAEIGLHDGQAIVRLFDAEDKPIVKADLNGVLRAPATARFDRELRFSLSNAGEYRAELDSLTAGEWRIAISATLEGMSSPFEAIQKVYCCD